MGLRGRLLLLLTVLVGAGLAGLAWVAGGLLHESAAQAMQLGGGPGPDPARLAEVLLATETVLWLAAGALLAVAVGVGAIALRGPIMGPLERLGRQLDRGPVAPGLSPDLPLIERIERTLSHQRRELERQRHVNDAHLEVVQAYRAAMEQARSQLVAADRLAMTGQLALGAAHELGGPLSIATTCLDTLGVTSAAPGREGAELLDQAAHALERVGDIAAELSAFGRPASKGGEEAGVAATAEKVRALSRLHKRCREATIVVSVGPEAAGARAAIGARHLEQVLLNLIVNAADATSGRGRIEIEVTAGDGEVLIAVQDDGPGVPEGLRSRIFEPFFSTKAEGSGLGLAVSRRLAQEAGGGLRLGDSGEGGARFELKLPAAP